MRFTLSALLVLVPLSAGLGQEPAWKAAVDSVFLPLDRTGSPGCALGVVQRGELVYAKGYGMANLEHGIPITSETAFYIASTSKQFTAAAINQLASDGKLDLDGSIRRWIPELPAWADSITPRHLVHHTSGIRDYLSLWSLSGRGFYDAIPLDEAIALIARQKATNFPAGTRHLYSNSGYLLLSVLVERVSGQPLSRYTAEHFFTPAGMTNTRFRDNRWLPIPNRADGHGLTNGRWEVFRTSFDLVGDGGLVTSVSDMARWERWFWEDSARAAFRARVLERGKLIPDSTISYAFGLVHGAYRGQPTIAHGGAFLGFLAERIRFPEQQTAIIVLCNTFTGNPSERARRVADAVLGSALKPAMAAAATPPQQPAQPWQPDRTMWPALIGRYASGELDAIYTVAEDSGQLVATVRQARMRLVPTAPDSFRMQGSRLVFTRDGKRRVTGLVISEGRANGIRFERLREP